MLMNLTIVGLRIEKYIDKGVSGANCNFEYYDKEFERHIICCYDDDNNKYELILWETEGECGSGWCTASWGHYKLKPVSKFMGYNYVPIGNLIIKDFDTSDLDIYNSIITVSYDGGDVYYPVGSYSVNMSYFKSTPRVKQNRPVWIFIGESNLGKSFIANSSNLSVYETDSSDTLKDNITEDIIVLGKKYKYSIDEIKEKLFENPEIHIVEFKLEKDYIANTKNVILDDDDVDLNEILKGGKNI